MDIAGPLPLEEAAPRPRWIVESNLDLSQVVRQAILEHPDASADEIVDLLKRENIEASGIWVAAEIGKLRSQARGEHRAP